MQLDNFETEINPTIMKRGRNYFHDGLIENLEETQAGLWKLKSQEQMYMTLKLS